MACNVVSLKFVGVLVWSEIMICFDSFHGSGSFKRPNLSTKVHPLGICCFLLFLAHFGSLSPTEAQQLKKVHAAIPAITPAAAPFAIAKDRGFYREEGLDVDLIVMPSAVGIQALIG